ncbi:hypothetical protein EXIGLDRAFT_340489 [Exidia glandulosa HHB12029]|uniref:Uncharacterized protein n=1 Tax=Exidia glandulosa HHB12029 TaxID=1314781 RepID=A0A165ZGH6_EXIGL|nr:hypothetical protein EXIGLDRAFT_340489 [Exidia glandulosa HHB12029]
MPSRRKRPEPIGRRRLPRLPPRPLVGSDASRTQAWCRSPSRRPLPSPPSRTPTAPIPASQCRQPINRLPGKVRGSNRRKPTGLTAPTMDGDEQAQVPPPEPPTETAETAPAAEAEPPAASETGTTAPAPGTAATPAPAPSPAQKVNHNVHYPPPGLAQQGMHMAPPPYATIPGVQYYMPYYTYPPGAPGQAMPGYPHPIAFVQPKTSPGSPSAGTSAQAPPSPEDKPKKSLVIACYSCKGATRNAPRHLVV